MQKRNDELDIKYTNKEINLNDMNETINSSVHEYIREYDSKQSEK